MIRNIFAAVLVAAALGLIISYVLTLTDSEKKSDYTASNDTASFSAKNAGKSCTTQSTSSFQQTPEAPMDQQVPQNNQHRLNTTTNPFDPDHLRLLGTARTPEQSPYAIIRNLETEAQNIYRIGSIIDGAKVSRIGPDRVMLEKDGHEYVLRMSGRNPQKELTNRMPAGHDLPPRDFSKPDISQIEKGWAAIQELMQSIELNPHFQNGQTNGMVVAQVESGSIFEAAGLKSGDVIQSVNGKEIQIADDAMEIYETFRTAETIEMMVFRQGHPVTLRYRP